MLFPGMLFLRICNFITLPSIQICPFRLTKDLTNRFRKRFLNEIENCNPGQNIWNKIEKSSKIGREKKSLISTFAYLYFHNISTCTCFPIS